MKLNPHHFTLVHLHSSKISFIFYLITNFVVVRLLTSRQSNFQLQRRYMLKIENDFLFIAKRLLFLFALKKTCERNVSLSQLI